MAADKKIKASGPKWSERVKVWMKKNSKVVTAIMMIIVIVAAVIFFLNLNSANRNKSAAEKLGNARAALMSRPHMVAAAVITDPQLAILPGISPDAPAAYILNLLQQQQLSLQAISPDKVREVQGKLGLSDETIQEPQKAAELGRELGADYILITKTVAGKPALSRVNPGVILGQNHWQAILIDVSKVQSIGQGAIWLEGAEDNPVPNSDFLLISRPYKVHTASPTQCLAAADEFKDITLHFSDTKSAKLAYLYLGEAYYQAGSFQDALDSYNGGDDKVNEPDLKFQCQLGAADSLAAMGKTDEALGKYEKLLSDFSPTGKALAPEILLRMAECYQLKKDVEGQKKVLAQLLKDYSQSPWLEEAQDRYRELFY